MGKSTISMVIFDSTLLVYQRVLVINTRCWEIVTILLTLTFVQPSFPSLFICLPEGHQPRCNILVSTMVIVAMLCVSSGVKPNQISEPSALPWPPGGQGEVLGFPRFFPTRNGTMWGPLVTSWFISPNNYSYKYHKPQLLKL